MAWSRWSCPLQHQPHLIDTVEVIASFSFAKEGGEGPCLCHRAHDLARAYKETISLQKTTKGIIHYSSPQREEYITWVMYLKP